MSTEHDHNYFETFQRLTPFVEDVSIYIAGFIVKSVSKKISCNICIQFSRKKVTNNVLINLKNRNNALINPTDDVIFICTTAKREFCSLSNVFLSGTKIKLFFIKLSK